MAEEVSYEQLQDLVRGERRSNKLTHLDQHFWRDTRTFLEEVTAEFRQEQAKDPFGRKVMLLTDEVKHARQAAESVWALRERKMSLYALAQVRETSPSPPEGLTPDEEDLFVQILQTLQVGRDEILGGAGRPISAGAVPKPAPIRAAPEKPSAPEGAPQEVPVPEPEQAAQEAPDVPTNESTETESEPQVVPADVPDDMVTIRAVGDIPPFVGPDMQTYLLKEGDIATVPEAIATLLVRRGKAETIEVS